jgi:hypothetical protein
MAVQVPSPTSVYVPAPHGRTHTTDHASMRANAQRAHNHACAQARTHYDRAGIGDERAAWRWRWSKRPKLAHYSRRSHARAVTITAATRGTKRSGAPLVVAAWRSRRRARLCRGPAKSVIRPARPRGDTASLYGAARTRTCRREDSQRRPRATGRGRRRGLSAVCVVARTAERRHVALTVLRIRARVGRPRSRLVRWRVVHCAFALSGCARACVCLRACVCAGVLRCGRFQEGRKKKAGRRGCGEVCEGQWPAHGALDGGGREGGGGGSCTAFFKVK